MYTDSSKKGNPPLAVENLFYFDDDDNQAQDTNSQPVSKPVQNDYSRNRLRKLQGHDIGKMTNNILAPEFEQYQYANMTVVGPNLNTKLDSLGKQQPGQDLPKQGYVPGRRSIRNLPSLKKQSPAGSAKEMQHFFRGLFQFWFRPSLPYKQQTNVVKYQHRAIPLNKQPVDIESDELQQIDQISQPNPHKQKNQTQHKKRSSQQIQSPPKPSQQSKLENEHSESSRRKRPQVRREKPHLDILQSDEDNHAQQENRPYDDQDPDLQVGHSQSVIHTPARQNLPKIIRSEDITNKRYFLLNPVPKGYIMEATIKRDKSGMGMFYPRYDLYLSDGYKYLMSGKRKAGNATSNYLISADKNDLQKGPNCLGKVRSNWVGTQFHVFDDGFNPQKPEAGKQVRKNLSTIYYQSNFFGTKGPRKLEVYIPNGQSSHLNQGLDLREAGSLEDAIKLVNKEPKWNQQLKAFVLNFNGRVDKPSVKNFILIQPGIDDTNVLLFGRTGQDVFTLDVQYPMSPIQAFGIALSSFDYKIACE